MFLPVDGLIEYFLGLSLFRSSSRLSRSGLRRLRITSRSRDTTLWRCSLLQVLWKGFSIGKKFFIKVKDLMHAGDHLPIVSLDTPMSKAVIELSSKRLGHAVVLDDAGKVAGVVTDGDVRRGLEKW